MNIVFFGTPDYVNPIIKSLDKNFDLIKTIRSTSAFHLRGCKLELKKLRVDLLVVASFGKIIPQEILEIPKLGAINIHPSELPKYRGPSPIQAQILDGVTDSAISFILMDEQMDHGPILHQEPFQISGNDTFESLCNKAFSKSSEILPQVIRDFAAGKIEPVSQNHAIASFCDSLEKEDGYFEIENPPSPEKLDRMIRAYYSWPTAWTRWNGKIVKLLPNPNVIEIPRSGEAILENTGIAASHVHETERSPRNDNRFLIQMEGKNVTDLKSFLNGYPDFPLKICGKISIW